MGSICTVTFSRVWSLSVFVQSNWTREREVGAETLPWTQACCTGAARRSCLSPQGHTDAHPRPLSQAPCLHVDTQEPQRPCTKDSRDTAAGRGSGIGLGSKHRCGVPGPCGRASPRLTWKTMCSGKVCLVQRITYSVSDSVRATGSGEDLKRGPSPWNSGTAASCSETPRPHAHSAAQSSGLVLKLSHPLQWSLPTSRTNPSVSSPPSLLSLCHPHETPRPAVPHKTPEQPMDIRPNVPGLSHLETPSTLEAQQGFLKEGDWEKATRS